MVQQIASAITLAVAALNAASSMALPMGSQAGDMDILERDFDDIMDLDARDAHGWGEDLSARANDHLLAPPPVAPHADGASNPLNTHPPSAAHGAPAHASPHPNGSKAMPGGPSKTVTEERTVTLQPTACGQEGGKGKGKGHQPTPPGHSKPTPTPVAKNGKNKRATKPKPSSVTPFPSGYAVYPKFTPAPSSTPPAAAGGRTSVTTKKGKDGNKTVVKVTFVRPTPCADLRGGSGHRHGGPKGGHGSGQQGNPNNRRPENGKGNKQERPGSSRTGKSYDRGHGKREIVDENELFGRSAFELDELD